jgi:hypothetical protein
MATPDAQEEETIPHPYREVQVHVLIKSVQAGATLATLVGMGLGVWRVARGRATVGDAAATAGRLSVIGAVRALPTRT